MRGNRWALMVAVAFLFCGLTFLSSSTVWAAGKNKKISPAKAAADIAKAEEFFRKYVQMENAFDPDLVKLYAPKAFIQNTRHFSDSHIKVLRMDVGQYCQSILTDQPSAKAKGESHTYSETTYTHEGDKVRIKCRHSSKLKKTPSPMEFLVGPDAKGSWKIIEEISESKT